MTDQKQYNELAARMQRLETLLQNNDAYSPPGAVTLADMDLGPGMDFSIPEFSQFFQQEAGGPPEYNEGVMWDFAWDPYQYADWQSQEMQFNDGFVESQSTVNELLSRLNAVETFLSGGSNDTAQMDALDWGATTGDDGQTGTGDASGVPAGYGPVDILVCDGSNTRTMTVIGTQPV